jgi:uncharacterized integral membrane protein
MSTSEHETPASTEAHAPHRTKRERGRTVAMVVLAILITVFAVLNLEDVHVDWIFGSGKAPLIVVIVISLVVGIVITYAAERRSGRRH